MPAPSVYDYMKLSHYLSDRFNFEKSSNRAFSHRYFVRTSGIRSQPLLSMIASGKRLPTPDIMHLICKGLKLNIKEKEYLGLIVDLERAQTNDLKASLIKRIHDLNPNIGTGNKLGLEQFASISSWYHIAILEMTYLKGFRPEPHWIVDNLHEKISLKQAEEALTRLTELGLLIKEGKRTKKAQTTLQVGNEIRSVAIRAYHLQVLELASRAVEAQAMEERLLTGATICLSKTQLLEVFETLKEAVKKVARQAHSPQGDQVYQLGLQFFKLTK